MQPAHPKIAVATEELSGPAKPLHLHILLTDRLFTCCPAVWSKVAVAVSRGNMCTWVQCSFLWRVASLMLDEEQARGEGVMAD